MGSLTGNIAEYLFHRLPNFKGRWRLLKAISRIHRSGLENPVVVGSLKSGFKMKLDLRARTEYEPFYTGEYDSKLLSAVSKLLQPGWVVLDVGANIGFYAVPLAKRLSQLEGTRLFCFEPVSSNFSRLRENLSLNGLETFTSLHPIALSNHEGTALITLREDFQAGGATGNAAIVIQDGSDAHFKTEQIQLTTLDKFVETTGLTKVDYIKADIEGHEDMLFEGGSKTIEKFRPIIQAELNRDYFRRKNVDIQDVLAAFKRRDYEVVRFDGNAGRFVHATGTEPRQVHEDIFLVPREKLALII